MIRSWRITKKKHAQTAFTGSGARKYGGRWNSPGTAIVYTAESQSLAVLEMLVHLRTPELLWEYVLIGVEIAEPMLQALDRIRLPRNWKADPPPSALKAIGDEWALARTSVALRVPSSLVPDENNVLLNPAHSDFARLIVAEPVPFGFDPRLRM